MTLLSSKIEMLLLKLLQKIKMHIRIPQFSPARALSRCVKGSADQGSVCSAVVFVALTVLIVGTRSGLTHHQKRRKCKNQSRCVCDNKESSNVELITPTILYGCMSRFPAIQVFFHVQAFTFILCMFVGFFACRYLSE